MLCRYLNYIDSMAEGDIVVFDSSEVLGVQDGKELAGSMLRKFLVFYLIYNVCIGINCLYLSIDLNGGAKPYVEVWLVS